MDTFWTRTVKNERYNILVIIIIDIISRRKQFDFILLL